MILILLERLTNLVDGWAKRLVVCLMRLRVDAYLRKLGQLAVHIDNEEELHAQNLADLRTEINAITGKLEAAKAALKAEQAYRAKGGVQ